MRKAILLEMPASVHEDSHPVPRASLPLASGQVANRAASDRQSESGMAITRRRARVFSFDILALCLIFSADSKNRRQVTR